MKFCRVRLPLGTAEIVLNRQGLDLSDRGGFEASWTGAEDAITLEAFHMLVKEYLSDVYQERYQQETPKITLNLAAHQLIDDVIGWSKLNYGSKPL